MIEINNTTRQKIDGAAARHLVEEFLCAYKRPQAELSLAIVGAARMRSLNKKYRKIDKTTDVLSFPGDVRRLTAARRAAVNQAANFLGEIVINIGETKKFKKYQAMFAEINMATERRARDSRYLFQFLLVHGLLHLVGYDDKTERQRRQMLKLGRDFLEKIDNSSHVLKFSPK